MKDLLFNGHDVVLMLVIGISFMLSLRSALSTGLARAVRTSMAIFFLLNAFICIDTLLFWGDSIKYAAFNLSPWLPTIFSFASFAIGPVLYWLIRSQTEPENPIRRADLFHLLPALATPVYLYWACYRYPLDQQIDLVLEMAIFGKTEAYFLLFLTLKKLMPLIYGVTCVTLIFEYLKTHSDLPAKAKRALSLYAGFCIIWGWILMTHILGQQLPVGTADVMGIFGNYMTLTLVIALWFSNTEASSSLIPIPVTREEIAENPLETAEPIPSTDAELDADILTLAQRIDRFMLAEKPYLNSRLTLERFAHLLQAPPRQVSLAINRCFEQNYQEYINRFRIEEAKRLLRDPTSQALTILEVGQRSGFNSKATFNRFFKSFVGVTPTAYREQANDYQQRHDIDAELVPQNSH
ncbi:AraC family transcriptional regulator [Saccharophagus sp. K07]|jgi:AraC-like DNA-binding protein|uniref:helix-turn-helix domain-containing protein n=1 Tax=Saccharophagus sp. K07 TaxID=2283636 RepID=UPI00165251E3|nr:AraC family transcriptional regulator [Saccharophagus sp. K07]MBC6904067.1 AraC family transcriptional regulator [Saccharophagus sp. K07]